MVTDPDQRPYRQDQKGYVHALEGILAALVIILYLTSFVTVPEPTDWTGVHVTKESEDILTALDTSGVLNDVIMTNNDDRFNTIIQSIDPSLAYTVQISDLPQPHIDVGVLVNDTQTYHIATTAGTWGANIQGNNVTQTVSTRTQHDWNQGTYNATSADRSDNSGILGLGYRNGTSDFSSIATGTGNGGSGGGNSTPGTHTVATRHQWNQGTYEGTTPFRINRSTITRIDRSTTFTYNGNTPQTWTVPSGVTEVNITVDGPGGGAGEDPQAGGDGGQVFATLDVSGYNTLEMYVAEGGWSSDSSNEGTGGWGRVTGGDGDSMDDAGGGGGLSAVVDPDTDTVLLKAGGGGGGGDTADDGGDGADSGVGGSGGNGDEPGDDGTGAAPDSSATNVAITTGGGSAGSTSASGQGDHGEITVEWVEAQSSDSPDLPDALRIGYRNGTAGDSLLGYWRLDNRVLGSGGTVQDVSGEQINGTTRNQVTTGVTGVFNTDAFAFSRTDDFVDLGAPSGLNVSGDSALTIAAWAKLEDSGGNYRILSLGEDWTDPALYATGSPDKWYFRTTDDDVLGANVNHGSWDHVVGTYNGSTIQVYVNGQMTGSAPANASISNYDVSAAIGALHRSDGSIVQEFNGTIDEVQVFDRALTTAEVEELYFQAQNDNVFEGNYTSETIAPNGTASWNVLNVNATIPASTDAQAVFQSLDTNGNTVDQQVIDLSAGALNYSLNVADSANAHWTINGTSTDEEDTWEVDSVTTYYNNSTSSGTGPGRGSVGDVVGYWRFDRTSGSVLDYSGIGNDGTNNGATRGVQGVFGTDAFQFDAASNEYVTVPDNSSLNLTSEITASTWVNLDSLGSGKRHGIIAKGSGFGSGSAAYGPYMLGYLADTGENRFYWDVWDDSYTRSSTSTSANVFNATGSWYHVTGTYNGTHHRLYVNGNLVDTSSGIGEMHAAARDLYVGNTHTTSENTHMDGTIDEPMLFDRALTADEVSALYLYGPSPFQGSYTRNTINIGSTTPWIALNVDATVPPGTTADAVFQALDSSGTVVDQQQFSLTSGDMNYSLNVADTEHARWIINGTSTIEEATWDVDETTVYYDATAVGGSVPNSEYGYRKGNLTVHPAFGDVPFVLSDTVENGVHKYTAVNFDLDGNGQFDAGPYMTGDRFECDAGVQGCSGAYYEVGPFNDTLTLYDARLSQMFSEQIGNVTIDSREVTINMDTVNPGIDRIERFDAVISRKSVSFLQRYATELESFLLEDTFLIVITETQKRDIARTYLGTLGFTYENKHGLYGAGPDTNLLYSIHGAGNRSYDPNNYYLQSNIRVQNFTDMGGYDEATLTIQETPITVRVSGGTARFGTDGFNTAYETGDTVNLLGNMYVLEQAQPLLLTPVREQRFSSFNTSRITADYYMTRMKNYMYNTTQYDESTNWSQEYATNQSVWGDVAESPCESPSRDPYKTGTANTWGQSVDFLMINFDEQGLEHGPANCTDYIEFVYFDLDGNGAFDEPGEGPYQRGDTVNINSQDYTVYPFTNGSGTELQAHGPRVVGEIPISDGAVSGQGRVALLNRKNLGDDDVSLIRSMLLSETGQRYWYTTPRTIGDRSFSYTYTGRTNGETPEYYMLDTIWWYE